MERQEQWETWTDRVQGLLRSTSSQSNSDQSSPEVEVHVTESRQSATEAFGPAREYSKQFRVLEPRASKVRTVLTTLVAGIVDPRTKERPKHPRLAIMGLMGVTFAVMVAPAWVIWLVVS